MRHCVAHCARAGLCAGAGVGVGVVGGAGAGDSPVLRIGVRSEE